MKAAPKIFNITYDPHITDCIAAIYTRVHAKNFRVPLSDDLLKARAIPRGSIRLHKLFERAATKR
jgi:hypothetical protein